MDSAVVLFSVKDKDLFGMSNQYIAECYISFQDIQRQNGTIEQIHLKLNRPRNTGNSHAFAQYKPEENLIKNLIADCDCIRALEYRQGDKLAKDFIKKLKQKMASS